MQFQDPIVFLLLPVVGVLIYIFARCCRVPGIRFSTVAFLKTPHRSVKLFLSRHIVYVRFLAAVLCVIALARPQSMLEESHIESEGIDIVLAVDVSSSMLAEDFTVKNKRGNRLAAVKNVVEEFIAGRSNDRIGLVAFAARTYTACPLTLDYGWLMQNIDRLEIGMIEDGTAVGSGLSTALNRIKDTEARGKVVILLTDGRNNAGNISPQTASEAAKALQVKVYTIGAGTKGQAPYPVKDFFGNTIYQPVQVDIDEQTLIDIAKETGGEYFRATDTASLKKIYQEIDRLETTPVEETGYLEYKELFPYVLVPALVLVLFEIVLSQTFLRRLP